MPNSSAAEMPRYTCDTAWPARCGPASWPAVSLAVPQNTGKASAGMKRASASTQMFGASAARRSRRRTPAGWRRTGSCGPGATARQRERRPGQHHREGEQRHQLAGRGIEMPRSRDMAGSRPTIRYSVVTIRKAAIARIRIEHAAARPGGGAAGPWR
jgi:hypothetical protein